MAFPSYLNQFWGQLFCGKFDGVKSLVEVKAEKKLTVPPSGFRIGSSPNELLKFLLKVWQGPGRNGPALAGRRKHRRDIPLSRNSLLAFREAQRGREKKPSEK
jgi:hypothetical protein